jgi:hypothetical protein
LTLLILIGLGVFLAAQETNAETVGTDPGSELMAHWYDVFHGISIGMEAGTHEFPLEVWYPGQEESDGYSVRSFYLMPNLFYERVIEDFHFSVEFDVIMDLGAPSPEEGAIALNSKDASRKDWYTIYHEEKMDYPISHLFGEVNFPGTLSVFLNHENYIYAYPEFPAVKGIRDEKGKVADGLIEIGPAAYDASFSNFGRLVAKLGLPITYLDRFSDDFGFGLNFTIGYYDIWGVNIGTELITRIAFLPDLEYVETEFDIFYSWHNFTAEVDIIASGAFETALIKPELKYNLSAFTFTLGVEIGEIGKIKETTFSPYIGINWSY